MERALWKGSLTFGLLRIPVSLHAAENRQELTFTMLDKRDLSPLGYERVNKRTGQRVEWSDIIKGYQYAKGSFVVLAEDDFKRANLQATQSVDIMDFVDMSEIEPVYFDRPYFLAPQPSAMKAYALLREALRRTGKVGIARLVIRTRQHLAAVYPLGRALVVNTLRFHHELRTPANLELPAEKAAAAGLGTKEIRLAERLITRMIKPWNPATYQDEYRNDLLRLMDEKVRAGQAHNVDVEQAAPVLEGPQAQVVDIMDLLQRSVAGRAEPEPVRRKSAAPRRGRVTRRSAPTRRRGRSRA